MLQICFDTHLVRGNTLFNVKHPLVKTLAEIKSALGHRELIIGHVGAHDIGSNLFTVLICSRCLALASLIGAQPFQI